MSTITSPGGAAKPFGSAKNKTHEKTEKRASESRSEAQGGDASVDSGTGLPVLGSPTGRTNRYIGKTGAEIMLQMLVEHGVTDAFGYPGGAILPTFDQLYKKQLNFVLVRHEQGAGHMADGYARATGKPGIVIVTSGPGATNTVTPLFRRGVWHLVSHSASTVIAAR